MKALARPHGRILAFLLAFLMVLQFGATTAFAADDAASAQAEAFFEDVFPEHSWYNDVYELRDAGIIYGVDATKFGPYRGITARQIIVTVARLLGEDDSDSAALVQSALDDRNLNPDWAIDSDLTREQAISLLFRELGALPGCENPMDVIYTNRQGFYYTVNVLGELGLVDIDRENPDGKMTRGEYAELLNVCRCLLLADAESPVRQLGFGYLPVTATENYEQYVEMMWGYAMNIPRPVMKAYHDSGYTIMLDNEYIESYSKTRSESKFTNVIGLFSSGQRCIYMTKPHAIMHEMGHFVETFMAGKEDIKPAFAAEAANSEEFLGSYSLTDSREYFGEVFRFFIQNRWDMMQMDIMQSLAPNTYQYFIDLEANNYLKPGNTDFLPNNFDKK